MNEIPFTHGVIIHGKRRNEIECKTAREAYQLWLAINKKKVVSLIQNGKITGRG